MRDRNRRTLLRGAFLCLCVLPTVVIATGVAWPRRQVDWSARLSDRLGIDVAVGQSSVRNGGRIQLGNIEFADPQLGILATLQWAEATEGDDGLVLTAGQAEVRLEHLDRLLQVVDQQISRRMRAGDSAVQLTIDELALREIAPDATASRVLKLSDFICRCDVTDDGTRRVRMSFRQAEGAERSELSFTRGNDSGELAEQWTLNTNGASLPVWPLHKLSPATKHLGHHCEFRGVIWARHTAGVFDSDVNGHFANVDLQQLVEEQFPHHLAGQAEVDLVRAHIRDGRLIDAAGSLVAGDGTIGKSLLEAAVEHLQLQEVNPSGDEAVPYEAIDLAFDIDSSTLRLRGHCAVAEGAILTDQAGQPLLIESTSHVPVLAVVRMLVPSSDVQVPLTTATTRILDVFPLPRTQ